VAAVVTVGAAVIEEKVAAGSPLDHGEVLELLSQPVDPEGETLHARVLVHIMTCLDVEGLANTFKLSEGALEQLDDELSVVEERFLIGVLGRRLLSLHQLPPTAAFVVVVLDPFFPASTAVGSSTPSPPSLGDRRFVVVNREEEEEVKKKMISLWKKQGKAGEGDCARELY
jgi:hypothetical protein